MKKKILAMLLAAVLAVGLLPGTAWAVPASSAMGWYNGAWEWAYSNGTLYIGSLGTGIMTDYLDGNSTMPRPWEKYVKQIHTIIIGGGMASIGDAAFEGCSNLTSVTIPDSVTKIGESAFYVCSRLTNVTIPDSVTEIGDLAFAGCASLTSVTIPDSVTEIGLGAFFQCTGLTSLTIPDSVTSIGRAVFADCTHLSSVIIPDSVTYIGELAFGNCVSLTSVTIPDSVTTIDAGAFYLCDSLKDVYYGGSESQWKQIFIDDSEIDDYGNENKDLLNATIHYAVTDPEPENPPAPAFTDVPAGEYYTDAVAWAVEKGVTTGATATIFNPTGDCTRAQIVTFLWRAYGSQEPASTVNPFTDVDPGEYYYKAVLWAVEKGITTGATATTFNPGGGCTRAQAVTFQYRAAGKPPVSGGSSFTDVPAGEYYTDAVAWAVSGGVTTGATATTFNPGGTCTRAQIVTFLYRELG